MQNPAPSAAAAVFDHTISHCLAETQFLMARALESTRIAMLKLEEQARTPGERFSLMESTQQLARLSVIMAERFPAALRQAITQTTLDQKKHTRSLFSVNFDELELMDEHQIHASVERARVREIITDAVAAALADLNGLASAAQGHSAVQAEHNPLRPDVVLQALQTVVGQMQVNDTVRRDWMVPMAQALGAELRNFYTTLTERLQQAGIKPLGYAIRQANGQYTYVAPTAQGHAPGFAAASAHEHTVATAAPAAPAAPHPQQESLLTLERLRRLLQGELDPSPTSPTSPVSPAPGQPAGRVERFAQQFAQAFEAPQPSGPSPVPADFAATVPAAFEALQEMQQVDRLVERLGQQTAARTATHTTPANLGQALGQEVVSLMVDNLAQDPRLLSPVQDILRTLEPALQRLVSDDPRFFSDHDHPARRLLQEITDRSLGFDQIQAPGFESFLLALQECIEPLAHNTAEGKLGFETVLGQLHECWAQGEKERAQEHERAVQSLWVAEQRHLLAARVARQIQHIPDFKRAPAEISAFLLGPWSQVLAHARLNNDTGRKDPGRYRELVDALLWSVQPEQAHKHPAQLARLVPKLLDRLHQGLASIGYPASELDGFIATLQGLQRVAQHSVEQAQSPETLPATAPLPAAPTLPPPEPSAAAPAPAPVRKPIAPLEDEPWVVPSEAKASGFIDIEAAPPSAPDSPPPPTAAAPAVPPAVEITEGTWVDLRVGERWERTQLTWAGPHGTLFLFTSANGRSQSMTRRQRDRLIAQDALRIVSEDTLVGQALDAVARKAMRNSMDSGF